MQRHSRLKGGHRVGINPNSMGSYQPVDPQSQPLSSNHQWNYQQTNWSQPRAYHEQIDHSQNENMHDTSWDWGNGSAEDAHSPSNQSSNQGVSSNYNQSSTSSHAAKDMASQFSLNRIPSPHVKQNRAFSHVAENITSSHGTYSSSNSQTQCATSSASHSKNLTSSLIQHSDNSQNQSVDEWGWNNDNWDDWGNGVGKPSISSHNNSFNNNTTTTLSQNSTVSSGNKLQEFSQNPAQVETSKQLQQSQPNFQMCGYNDNQLAQSQTKKVEDTSLQYQHITYQPPVTKDQSQSQFAGFENSNFYAGQYEQHSNQNYDITHANNFNDLQQEGVIHHQNEYALMENDNSINKVSNLDSNYNDGEIAGHSGDSTNIQNQHLPNDNFVLSDTLQKDTEQLIDIQSPKDDWKWDEEDLNAMNKVNDDLSNMIDHLSLDPSENKDLNMHENICLHGDLSPASAEIVAPETYQSDQSACTNSKNNHYLDSPSHVHNTESNFGTNFSGDVLLEAPDVSTYYTESQMNRHMPNETNASFNVHQNKPFEVSEINNDLDLEIKREEVFAEPKPATPSAPVMAEWDDEWNDGWGKPPDSEIENVHHEKQYANYDSFQNQPFVGNHDLSEITQSTEDAKMASASNNLPEVKNIHELNQELHGIFRSPSGNMSIKSNLSGTYDETIDNRSSFSYDNPQMNINSDLINLETPSSYNETAFGNEGRLHEEYDGYEGINVLPKHSFKPDSDNFQEFAENFVRHNLVSGDDGEYQAKVTGGVESFKEITNRPTFDSRPHSNQSSASHSSLPQPSSNYSGVGQSQFQDSSSVSSSLALSESYPSISSSTHVQLHNQLPVSEEVEIPASLVMPTQPVEIKSIIPVAEQFQPIVSPAPIGPVGNISQFHARKGSPFQPPNSKKHFSPQHSFQSQVNNVQPVSDSSQKVCDSTMSPSLQQSTVIGAMDMSAEYNIVAVSENSLIAHSQPPDQVVKLSIASTLNDTSVSSSLEHSENKHEIIPNAVPVLIRNANDSAVSNEVGLEMLPPCYSPTHPPPIEVVFINQQQTPPPAHLNNKQPTVFQPKVKKFSAMENTPSSPSVLDLTQTPFKQERTVAVDRTVPSFSRMVPGESTKGESSGTAFYQPPTVVPEMPSERVVTGNAYPQPIPTSRIKQEPSDVRSPPDGPDTADRRSDQNSSVVPPIRSETIGSEDMVARPLPSDRRDERNSEGRRDRTSWDRDPYDDRHIHERKREGRGRYRDESPYRRHNFERDYDSRVSDRYHSQRDSDDEDDDDHERYSEVKKERRNKGYRDELDRYQSKDLDYQRHRRRDYHGSQEDEDPYYEGRPERSRPSSRSSSYVNLVGDGSSTDLYESSQRGCKEVNQRDRDYRDREREFRDRERDFRDRERDGKDRERGHREAEPPFRDSRMKGSRDPYMAAGYPYPDQYGSRGVYDAQSYYYYYQNYVYRDYYRRLYGSGYGYPPGGDSMVDDKASIRSGRSSVDELKKSSVSSHFRQDFIDQSSTLGGFEPSAIYPEHENFSQLQPYASGEVSGVPSVTDEGGSDVQQRLSPLLFSGTHLAATFTSGGKLLLVLPNDPKQGEKARVQIRNVQKMLIVDKELATRIHKMKAYPGPLIVSDTHKDVVISFCNKKAAEALADKSLFDQDSVILFWEYLALLVKQNGKVCGADWASLLLKGREVGLTGEPNSPLDERPIESLIIDSSPPEDKPEFSHQTQQFELVRKFTELLCLGRKKEAVDFAIREGLWGYAMTLAAKMDLATHTATHTRVMSAFIQSIPKTHVLQTLFQHLSGKRPEVSKTYCEERWGDWRLHLAMMVSNPTGQFQRDKASIFAFGDTLAAKNCLHAAHLCYLAAEADWGTFSDKESKLVLIGTSHHQPFQVFASDDAIQCTEIYEYAKALDSSSQMMSSFQSYKFVYALRLAEAGFPSEALRYCEVISQAVMKNMEVYKIDFVSRVLDLATQLKYHDVHYLMGEGEAREMPDPDWLLNLQNVLYTLQYQAAQQRELAATTQEQVVKEEQHAYECSTMTPEPPYPYNAGVPNKTNNLSTITDNISLGFSPNKANHLDAPYPEKSQYLDGMSIQDSRPEIPMIPTQDVPYEDNMQSSLPYDGSLVGDNDNSQVPMMNNSAPSSMAYYGNTDSQPMPPLWNHQQQSWQASQEQAQWQSNQPPPQSWQQEDYHNSHYSSINDDRNGHDMTDSSSSLPPQNSNRDAEEEQYWAMMSKKGVSNDTAKASTEQKDEKSSLEGDTSKIREEISSPKSGDDNLDDKKSAGFLGSLFGGWRKANNNQAKLPDDKNPSIVWDEERKKWVNVDGDEADESTPPPPPSSLAGPPNIASFRGGLRKSRYVDPVGEKSRAKPSASPLLPPMPNASPIQPTPVKQMEPANFMPQAPDNQPQLNLGPQNEIQGAQGESMGPIPMMGPPDAQGQPMFFNPSQMKPSQPNNQPKRAGPSRRVFNSPR